jgi:hypothetical protein
VYRSVAAAGGVLLLGGLVFGGLPVPLADYGCEPGFASQAPIEGSFEVTVACAAARSDRQNVAYSLLLIGLAAVTGAVVGPRGRVAYARQPTAAWLVQRDSERHEADAVPEPRS